MYNLLKSLNYDNSEIMILREYLSPVQRKFKRGETISICRPSDDTIGIVTSGTAYLITINNEGQRRILEYYQRGNAFGGHFVPFTDSRECYLTAKTECCVDFVRYSKMIACNNPNITRYGNITNHFVSSNIKKALIHSDVLCQQSLRNKILTFFDYLSSNKNSKSFTIPLTLSDMAEYLSVDRSAMMREIKKLNDEGVIKSERRKVTIL
ncbi:MAG: Crp/Fnr family transcriptional regulator [Ruminococcus sp.]|nr:Crp/Fnr family transcriptional regulator [Ruminococcus sp.]